MLLAGATTPSLDQLRRSALSGDREAAFALGRAYKLGDEAPLDTGEAARWLQKAAQLGHARAGGELGLVLYQDGKVQEALPWLRRGAEQGDARAQYALGQIYFAGKFVAADPQAAKSWMGKAAKAGLPAATEALAIMSRPAPAEPMPVRSYDVVTILPSRRQPTRSTESDGPQSVIWQAQLGVFSVIANAERLWRLVRSEATAPLRASLAKGGGLTRLRVAPFPSRAAAERFCAGQRRRNRDCLVIRGAG